MVCYITIIIYCVGDGRRATGDGRRRAETGAYNNCNIKNFIILPNILTIIFLCSTTYYFVWYI